MGIAQFLPPRTGRTWVTVVRVVVSVVVVMMEWREDESKSSLAGV